MFFQEGFCSIIIKPGLFTNQFPLTFNTIKDYLSIVPGIQYRSSYLCFWLSIDKNLSSGKLEDQQESTFEFTNKLVFLAINGSLWMLICNNYCSTVLWEGLNGSPVNYENILFQCRICHQHNHLARFYLHINRKKKEAALREQPVKSPNNNRIAITTNPRWLIDSKGNYGTWRGNQTPSMLFERQPSRRHWNWTTKWVIKT